MSESDWMTTAGDCCKDECVSVKQREAPNSVIQMTGWKCHLTFGTMLDIYWCNIYSPQKPSNNMSMQKHADF